MMETLISLSYENILSIRSRMDDNKLVEERCQNIAFQMGWSEFFARNFFDFGGPKIFILEIFFMQSIGKEG